MRFPHWQFFESIDDDLYALSRIIEFEQANFPTHSVYLARLYLSICSEIDVVAKLLCKWIGPGKPTENIDSYRTVITGKYPNFSKLKIEMPAHGLHFQPWLLWDSGKNPLWWKSYNNVKHERNEHYREANLGNVLESAAGLLAMLTYWHQPELYSTKSGIEPRFKTMKIDTQYVFTPHLVCRFLLPDFGPGPKVEQGESAGAADLSKMPQDAFSPPKP
jgi:hypothetical protein